MQKTYITSPIYYVNDVAHIGHAYTTILCDMLKRFYSLLGHEVLLTTGTDEHGQKIEQSALKANKTPQDYADGISKEFRDLWDSFGISYDLFVRTTDKEHCISVQKAYEIMKNKGDIYKGMYEGHYCVSCESFFSPSQLGESGSCPDCGKATQIIQEESYFFALSKYQSKILQWLESDESSIFPEYRKNEVIRFIQEGLNDLSITRTGFEWGVDVSDKIDSKKHVVYVWLDALLSYISILGYNNNLENKMSYWENAIHIVGKDILRFHGIYWIGFLLSLDLPLPKRIFAHGWWTIDGVKMSKSIGNVVNPKLVVQYYGIDALRYFLIREVPFGQDGDFSQTALIDRINAELGNDLGNLLNRLIGMSEKYTNLVLDSTNLEKFFKNEMDSVAAALKAVESKMHLMQPHKYIEELWKIYAFANALIAKYEPWNMQKNKQIDKVNAFLTLLANILIKTTFYLYPIMPSTAQKIAQCFGIKLDSSGFKDFITESKWLTNLNITKIPPLFPRIESKLMPESKLDSTLDTKNANSNETSKAESKKNNDLNEANLIDISDFSKVDIRIGSVVECENVPKSDKLLKLQVDIGEETPRQIISGIAKHYQANELIGKQVCVIVNLKPAKLMGLVSNGMILAGKDANGLVLIGTAKALENGSKIT